MSGWKPWRLSSPGLQRPVDRMLHPDAQGRGATRPSSGELSAARSECSFSNPALTPKCDRAVAGARSAPPHAMPSWPRSQARLSGTVSRAVYAGGVVVPSGSSCTSRGRTTVVARCEMCRRTGTCSVGWRNSRRVGVARWSGAPRMRRGPRRGRPLTRQAGRPPNAVRPPVSTSRHSGRARERCRLMRHRLAASGRARDRRGARLDPVAVQSGVGAD